MIRSNHFLAVAMMVVSLLLAGQTHAVPAHPAAVKVRQPDGTTITVRLHGDEYQHYNTTADGYTILKNPEGYYVYATLADGRLQPTPWIAHDPAERADDEQTFLRGVSRYTRPDRKSLPGPAGIEGLRRAAPSHTSYNTENFRGLVILVEFNDKSFSRKNFETTASNMLNKEKYKGILPDNLMAGSVRDYFSDMSDGQFKPQFDVVGPVKLPYSQYDAHQFDNAWKLMAAALDSIDRQVDFRLYDGDGDQVVDLVYFIFAGNGSNYSGNDERLIWPHASIIYTIDDKGQYQWVRKDGVRLNDCACSVELYGWTQHPSTIKIDGIATIVHEFSHVLGLPDFYDADGEESGGESRTPGSWDVMAGGCYGTPVAYTLFERWFMRWADPERIDSAGTYTLDKLTKNVGYRIDSAHKNEFFLLENRQSDDKWNADLPGHGMMVYRIDLSNQGAWLGNDVNSDPSHSFYELVRANPDSLSDSGSDPFPGRSWITRLTNHTSPANLRSWSGLETPLVLVNIREDKGLITFDVVDADSEVGVRAPLADPQSAPPAIFTPDGRQVPAMSRPGLYILRQGTTTRKVWK
ncbi:MAG: M6 family metalloprotease domain-containing protein [Bacteroidales bacterium]|nr:M6 family metalloprotease domain-containing protein [Bacteroidales bacterium]